MTVKNRSWDHRFLKTAPQGNVSVGAYGYKNQNGVNSPVGGPLRENAYTMSAQDAMDAGLLCRYQPDYGHRFWNLVKPSWSGTPSFTANDEIKLINKLAVAFDNRSVELGIALGELPQTVGQLADITRRAALETLRLKRHILDLVKNSGKVRNRMPQDPMLYNIFGTPIGTKTYNFTKETSVGSLWLGGSFGLRPLIDTAFQIADTIATSDLRTNIVRARGIGSVFATPLSSTVATVTGTGVARRQIIAKLQSEQTWPSSLGLQDPASIIWELVPWSFAIDWFTPIGGFIAAQSFVMRAKGTFTTTNSVKYRGTAVGKLGPIPGTPGWVGIESTGPGSYNYTVVTRTTSTSLPGMRLPGLKSSLLGGEPLNRLANAFSLLSQVIGKR